MKHNRRNAIWTNLKTSTTMIRMLVISVHVNNHRTVSQFKVLESQSTISVSQSSDYNLATNGSLPLYARKATSF